MTAKKPHDSAFVWSSTKGKHWYAGFTSLQEKEPGRGEFLILAFLMILILFAGSFGGFLLQTQIINPPTQVIGYCPPPAFIQKNDCLKNVTTIDAQGNSHTVVQEAGNILGGFSRSICSGGICVGAP